MRTEALGPTREAVIVRDQRPKPLLHPNPKIICPENLTYRLLQAYIADFEAYEVAKTSQLNEVEKHSLYLFEYSNALATIIMNFEKGLYPVYEKSGVKAAAIPDKAKPGPMSAEVASRPSSPPRRKKSRPHVCREATPRL